MPSIFQKQCEVRLIIRFYVLIVSLVTLWLSLWCSKFLNLMWWGAYALSCQIHGHHQWRIFIWVLNQISCVVYFQNIVLQDGYSDIPGSRMSSRWCADVLCALCFQPDMHVIEMHKLLSLTMYILSFKKGCILKLEVVDITFDTVSLVVPVSPSILELCVALLLLVVLSQSVRIRALIKLLRKCLFRAVLGIFSSFITGSSST